MLNVMRGTSKDYSILRKGRNETDTRRKGTAKNEPKVQGKFIVSWWQRIEGFKDKAQRKKYTEIDSRGMNIVKGWCSEWWAQNEIQNLKKQQNNYKEDPQTLERFSHIAAVWSHPGPSPCNVGRSSPLSSPQSSSLCNVTQTRGHFSYRGRKWDMQM